MPVRYTLSIEQLTILNTRSAGINYDPVAACLFRLVKRLVSLLKQGVKLLTEEPALRMRSIRLVPGLKAGYLDAGIPIFSLVPGLTPLRALRSLTSKVPKPVSCTVSPLDRWLAVCSKRASMTVLASLALTLVPSETFWSGRLWRWWPCQSSFGFARS